ncbi:MAG: hypothetical protein QNJ14_08910 [Woeseiaceae bacterium]|nr:hypothetical protein [Woeseiaceae bacterium]
MADFFSTNAILLIATLGAIVVVCALLLSWLIARRVRQRRAVRILLNLADTQRCYATGAFASLLVHDLNNLILVLSLESERLESEATETPVLQQQATILRQLETEGREVVERCRSHATPVVPGTSALGEELRIAADLVRDTGITGVELAVAKSVPTNARLSRPAADVHLLVLSLVRAALGDRIDGRRLTLTVSTGRDDSLPGNDNNADWISLSALGRKALPGDDPRVVELVHAARRLAGEVAVSDACSTRQRFIVSLPVVEDQY